MTQTPDERESVALGYRAGSGCGSIVDARRCGKFATVYLRRRHRWYCKSCAAYLAIGGLLDQCEKEAPEMEGLRCVFPAGHTRNHAAPSAQKPEGWLYAWADD